MLASVISFTNLLQTETKCEAVIVRRLRLIDKSECRLKRRYLI